MNNIVPILFNYHECWYIIN